MPGLFFARQQTVEHLLDPAADSHRRPDGLQRLQPPPRSVTRPAPAARRLLATRALYRMLPGRSQGLPALFGQMRFLRVAIKKVHEQGVKRRRGTAGQRPRTKLYSGAAPSTALLQLSSWPGWLRAIPREDLATPRRLPGHAWRQATIKKAPRSGALVSRTETVYSFWVCMKLSKRASVKRNHRFWSLRNAE
jgi:hypothetical protein